MDERLVICFGDHSCNLNIFLVQVKSHLLELTHAVCRLSGLVALRGYDVEDERLDYRKIIR